MILSSHSLSSAGYYGPLLIGSGHEEKGMVFLKEQSIASKLTFAFVVRNIYN